MWSVNAKNLHGELEMIDSKSILHRYLILASFQTKPTRIYTSLNSQDISATIDVLTKMGATIVYLNDHYFVQPQKNNTQNFGNCFNSGSTIRFLIPFTFLLNQSFTFLADQQLAQRSLNDYFEFFEKYNVYYKIQSDSQFKLTVDNNLNEKHIEIDGSHSSQFVSGLLMMMAFNCKIETLTIKNEIVSKPYLDLTIDALKKFGYKTTIVDNTYCVSKVEQAQDTLIVEKDFSQAAFFLVANYFNSNIKINDLNPNSLQADAIVLDYIKEIRDNQQKQHHFDLKHCPDLGPILMVLSAGIDGISEFSNIERLLDKESNRLQTMLDNFILMNVKYKLNDNHLIVIGQKELYSGGFVATTNHDHRIIMAMTIASILCEKPILFENFSGIEKSYPQFFLEIKKLGGIVCQVSD